MSENLFDRQRAALARLTDAVRARVAAEAALAAEFQAAADKAEREVARARKSNAAARQSELGRIDDTHTRPRARSPASTTPSSSPPTAPATTATTRPPTKFRDAEQRGRTEYKDSCGRRLDAGGRREGREGPARIAPAEGRRRHRAGRRRCGAEAEPAAGPRPRDARADVESPANCPPPADDDPIKRMNKWLADGRGSRSTALRGLLSPEAEPRVAGWSCWCSPSARSARASFAFLDPARHVPARPPAVAIVLGLRRCGSSPAGSAARRRCGTGSAMGAAPGRGRPRRAAAQRVRGARVRRGGRPPAPSGTPRKRRETDEYYQPLLASAEEAVRGGDAADRGRARRADGATAPPAQRRDRTAEEEHYRTLRPKIERPARRGTEERRGRSTPRRWRPRPPPATPRGRRWPPPGSTRLARSRARSPSCGPRARESSRRGRNSQPDRPLADARARRACASATGTWT